MNDMFGEYPNIKDDAASLRPAPRIYNAGIPALQQIVPISENTKISPSVDHFYFQDCLCPEGSLSIKFSLTWKTKYINLDKFFKGKGRK